MSPVPPQKKKNEKTITTTTTTTTTTKKKTRSQCGHYLSLFVRWAPPDTLDEVTKERFHDCQPANDSMVIQGMLDTEGVSVP